MSDSDGRADDLVPDELLNSQVLITGGAGFIGSHLADTLVDHADVRILDDLSTGTRANVPEAATFIEGDIRDEATVTDAAADVDVVFHEAANSSVKQSVEDPLESHRTNIMGSVSVLEAARKADARVVSASSAAIYGVPDRVPITEQHPKQPTSPYGVEKLALDRDTMLYNDVYGLPTVNLRYFNVYGPRQVASEYSGVIDVFLGQAKRNDNITIDGDGSQTRDFVHIDDIVQANLRAAVTDSVGESYNIGNGGSITIEELAESVRSVTDSASELTYTDPRPGDIPESCADISKAQRELGYDPQLSLNTGLSTLAD